MLETDEIYKKAFEIYVRLISIETNISYQEAFDMLNYDDFIHNKHHKSFKVFEELAKKQLRKEKLIYLNKIK